MINRSMDAPKWIGNLSSILIIWIIWKDKFHDEKSQSFFTAQKSIRSVCIIEILNTSRSKDTCNINVIETKRNSYFQTKKLFHLHIVFALKTFRFWERKKQHVQTCIVMKSVSWTICFGNSFTMKFRRDLFYDNPHQKFHLNVYCPIRDPLNWKFLVFERNYDIISLLKFTNVENLWFELWFNWKFAREQSNLITYRCLDEYKTNAMHVVVGKTQS